MSETEPYAYFITFTCYGARLHGDERASVDRFNNVYDAPHVVNNIKRVNFSKSLMSHDKFLLNSVQREIILKQLVETCKYKNWRLLALHVRSNHLHIVVKARVDPNIIMNVLKAYASRAINIDNPLMQRRKKWTTHGSTRYLWNGAVPEAAIHYVIHEQGSPMAVYENKSRDVFDDLV